MQTSVLFATRKGSVEVWKCADNKLQLMKTLTIPNELVANKIISSSNFQFIVCSTRLSIVAWDYISSKLLLHIPFAEHINDIAFFHGTSYILALGHNYLCGIEFSTGRFSFHYNFGGNHLYFPFTFAPVINELNSFYCCSKSVRLVHNFSISYSWPSTSHSSFVVQVSADLIAIVNMKDTSLYNLHTKKLVKKLPAMHSPILNITYSKQCDALIICTTRFIAFLYHVTSEEEEVTWKVLTMVNLHLLVKEDDSSSNNSNNSSSSNNEKTNTCELLATKGLASEIYVIDIATATIKDTIVAKFNQGCVITGMSMYTPMLQVTKSQRNLLKQAKAQQFTNVNFLFNK